MNKRRLFIFVEGNDDQRFFTRIVRPLVESGYASVEIIMYASMKSVNVCRFIRSITAMDHDFILCSDIDQERNVKAKKIALKTRFCTHLADDRIVVIIQEIESWYLAGLDEKAQKRYSLRPYRGTNHITKEIFNRMIPRNYISRIAFMAEILDHFKIDAAQEKNRSFRYFFTRFVHPIVMGGNEKRDEVFASERTTSQEISRLGNIKERAGEDQVKPEVLHPPESGNEEDS
ncbi:MAG: DUF4276 family protein [Methanoregulaceae archaeon]|nr:DUF4276 family protein [Methanoregulaceae archaeon]